VTIVPERYNARKELEEFEQDIGAQWQPLKALVIINDEGSASSIASALSQGGFEVISASNCAEGLLRVDEFCPHLVLLAEMLPGSGETCSRIRGALNIPVVMLGSDSSEQAWLLAVALGADAYLSKSIGACELVARIKAILRRYQKR
jgi:DNA-binding response OmpR family regulator